MIKLKNRKPVPLGNAGIFAVLILLVGEEEGWEEEEVERVQTRRGRSASMLATSDDMIPDPAPNENPLLIRIPRKGRGRSGR